MDKIRKALKKNNGDVIYFQCNEIFNFDGTDLTLYSLCSECDGFKINFMVKGKKIMKIYSTNVSESTYYPAKNGGLEYFYEPMNDKVIEYVENQLTISNKSIINFVLSNSYLIKQNSDISDLRFTTRLHSWGGQYGDSDIDECNRVRSLLLKKFTDIEVEITTCDEWVNLYVNKL